MYNLRLFGSFQERLGPFPLPSAPKKYIQTPKQHLEWVLCQIIPPLSWTSAGSKDDTKKHDTKHRATGPYMPFFVLFLAFCPFADPPDWPWLAKPDKKKLKTRVLAVRPG